ncbi:MAG: AAA family ATPase [Paludibacteraceae bacterium]|nr:AAA family ATPase [Paludibacteraceae bacterium]
MTDYSDINTRFKVTESYFNKACEVSKILCDFYDKVSKNKNVLHLIYTMEDEYDFRVSIRTFFMLDLIKCYRYLGHNAANLFTREGLPMSIVMSHILESDYNITFSSIRLQEYKDIVKMINEWNKSVIEDSCLVSEEKPEDFFFMNVLFKECNSDDLRTQYFSLLYRFFSVVAKSDDKITHEESEWLEKLMKFSAAGYDYDFNNFDLKRRKIAVDEKRESESIKSEYGDFKEVDSIDELKSLIGLTEVKNEVVTIANFIKIQQQREKSGMKSVRLSYHCIFTGNPGTGKTTVARILAAIYKDLGVLEKGHLVETDRSGLVAEYVGQTAVKTNKIIDEALDGVLFIDEAYSLIQGGDNDYGMEAISTLLKRMEDERSRLVVILAGYSDEMKRFIDSNPGLQSRFSRYIHFPDYTVDELKQIFLLNVENNQYHLDVEGQTRLEWILKEAVDNKIKNFGNGRYVRNLFEKTIQKQAMRLSCLPNVSVEDLSKLKAEDIG